MRCPSCSAGVPRFDAWGHEPASYRCAACAAHFSVNTSGKLWLILAFVVAPLVQIVVDFLLATAITDMFEVHFSVVESTIISGVVTLSVVIALYVYLRRPQLGQQQ